MNMILIDFIFVLGSKYLINLISKDVYIFVVQERVWMIVVGGIASLWSRCVMSYRTVFFFFFIVIFNGRGELGVNRDCYIFNFMVKLFVYVNMFKFLGMVYFYQVIFVMI